VLVRVAVERKENRMPVKRILRGVQDIKTISGRVDKGSVPYKAYMKLSVLEMEKYRRGKEKSSALTRVAHIDQRFQDIERERDEILKNMEIQERGVPARRISSVAPKTNTGTFKIRY
jgi:hypothetical protein